MSAPTDHGYFAVRPSKRTAKHHLVVGGIGDANSRAHGSVIARYESASVFAPRAEAGKAQGARIVVDLGIRTIWREIRILIVQVHGGQRALIAQSESDCE